MPRTTKTTDTTNTTSTAAKAVRARKPAGAKTKQTITVAKARTIPITTTPVSTPKATPKSRWTPRMIQDIQEAAEAQSLTTEIAEIAEAEQIAEAAQIPEAPAAATITATDLILRRQIADAVPLVPEVASNVLRTHGPDASLSEIYGTDPRMIEAREWLSNLIANPPRYPDGSVGSIRVKVDKYRAIAIRERNVGHNRKKKPRLVRHLVGVIQRGEWVENGQTIGISSLGETINGQHRAEAIEIADPEGGVWVDLRLDLPPEAFKAMDNGAPRTNADVLGIAGHRNINALAAACRMMYRYEMVPSMRDLDGMSPDQTEITLAKYPDLAEGVALQGHFRKGGLTSGAAGAVFWVLARRHNPYKAQAFLKKFETGIGIVDEDDAVLRARTYFSNINKGNRRASPEQMLSVIIKSFNAFALDRSIKPIRAVSRGEAFPQVLPPDANHNAADLAE